jgi:putative membrane protein
MHNGEWNHGGGSWMWIPMVIMMIAFWGGLIWLAVALIRRPNHPLHTTASDVAPPQARHTAQEILAERLARGEIEPDDYRQRLDALSHQTKP